jgi:beta-galactosidase/beta-glucuronidase
MRRRAHFLLLAVACAAVAWGTVGCGGHGDRPTVVQVYGRGLYVNGAPFHVRGVVYSPVPVGQTPETWSWPTASKWYDDDFDLLYSMNCNTIRTLRQVNQALLDAAHRHGLMVVCGFEVDATNPDFSDATRRQLLKDQFRAYVAGYRNHPAVLMWCVGDEVNKTAGSSSAWYTLLDELAAVGHQEEGQDYHPVTTANSEIDDIGSDLLATTDAQMPHLDLWGANVFRGYGFGGLFDVFTSRSQKAFWVSEYGADAFDSRPAYQQVNQAVQAQVDLGLWGEIEDHFATCVGGCLMGFCDEWWRAGNPSEQNQTSRPLNVPPDNLANDEYWGMFAVSPQDSAPDQRLPRQVYSDLSDEWRP